MFDATRAPSARFGMQPERTTAVRIIVSRGRHPTTAPAGLAVLIVTVASHTAAAERRSAEWLGRTRIQRLVLTDEHRWQAAAGVSWGWQTTGDVELRRHVSDRVALGARVSFAGDVVPVGGELRLTAAVVRPYASEHSRVDLLVVPAIGWTTFDERVQSVASGGLVARFVLAPHGRRSYVVELGARAGWAPIDERVVEEISLAIGIVWGPRLRCETVWIDRE